MSNQREIQIKGIEFKNACEAIQHADNDGEPQGKAITIGGKFLVVQQAEADRIAAMGVSFAYINDCNGRVVTVPIN
jgi:hypothetical protein